MYENFLAYGRYVWGKLTLATTLVLVISYIIYSRRVSPNGATLVGLIYGIISFVAILLLMYYGMRKRSYTAKHWSLRAWLSFHVYIGTMTLLLVPLHAGFKFGFDIHTLAYVLLVMVVGSGIVGAALYLLLPRRFEPFGEELTYPMGHGTDEELRKIIRQMRALAIDKSQEFADACQTEIEYGIPKRHVGWGLLWRKRATAALVATQIEAFQDYLQHIPEVEHEAFQNLARLATQKRDLEHRMAAQMRLQNLLEAWLYIHLPVSLVMFIVVIIHILVVFYYGYVVST
jgi:hypothetical protein